jgi:hypothetical protein
MVLIRVRAPAPTFAAVRTTTEVIGKPPISPDAMLPIPCALNLLENNLRADAGQHALNDRTGHVIGDDAEPQYAERELYHSRKNHGGQEALERPDSVDRDGDNRRETRCRSTHAYMRL